MDKEKQFVPRKLKIWLPLLLSLVLVLGMLVGIKMQTNPAEVAVVTQKQQIPPSALGQGKIEEFIRYIEAKYVDDINQDELVKEAIDNILKQLDPHSNYISADHLKEVNEQLQGNFEGIGIEFLIMDDTIVVVSPLAGGPSEKIGILEGDRIVEIGDSLVAGVHITTADIMAELRGAKGTEVSIGILRGNEKEIRSFTITRDKIPVNSVDVAYMLDEETGYIKINRFSANTYKEFMEGLETLVEKKGMKDLVIDLRQNPGGYLQEATDILSQLFKEKNKLLVYTEGRTASRSDYESTGRSFFDIDDIAVLIDEGSASASEILAGAIQDWDRGVIVGRRSFGKGLVQEQYRLRDGSAIRLTVARYYTPSGRLIQKSYKNLKDYDEDVANRIQHGEMYSKDSIPIADTTVYLTAGGRVVYGGGGITPDFFIPLDPNILNDYYLHLRPFIRTFVFHYLSGHKADFEQLTLEEFQADNFVNEDVLNDFLAFAKQRGVKNNSRQWRRIKPEFKRLIKADLAKNLFGNKGYYSVWNLEDKTVKKALEVLKQENPLSLKGTSKINSLIFN